MKVLIIGAHPSSGLSMRRYTRLVEESCARRGIRARVMCPPRIAARLPGRLAKFGVYVDTFLLGAAHLASISRRNWDAILITDHSNAALAYCVPRSRLAIVCHDLIAVRAARGEVPHHSTRASGRLYQALVVRGLRRARLVACVSHATEQDVERIVGVPTTLMYNPVDETFTDGSGGAPTASTTFVVVAPAHWRKNRAWAIRLWVAMRNVQSLSSSTLIIVGNPLTADESEILHRAGASESVSVQSSIDDTALRTIYRQSIATIQPSLYEGFGWPIVEGQSLGTPAICIDTPVYREVGGEGALYVPADFTPQRATDVARTLIENSEILAHRSVQNAERFTSAGFDESLTSTLASMVDSKS